MRNFNNYLNFVCCKKQKDSRVIFSYRLLLLLLFVMFCVSVSAQRDFERKYNLSDYTIADSLGVVRITCNHHDYCRSGDLTYPNFPYTPLRVLIPNDSTRLQYRVDFDKVLISSNVRVEANTPCVTTNGESEVGNLYATTSVISPVYDGGVVPFNEYKYMYLKITPFLYDQDTGSLYFVSNVKINFPGLTASQNNQPAQELSENQEYIAEIVDNAQDIVKFYPIYDNSNVINDPVDYLIITNKYLEDSFLALRSWKRMKGYNTHIVTIEDIHNTFPCNDVQESIRACISFYKSHNGVKFVLLGGDDSVVPVRMCEILTYDKSGQTPADIYYSCFDYDFKKNDEGVILGKDPALVSFNPKVYLSRLPFRTKKEVENFTKKLIGYERYINNLAGTNRLLMAGVLESNTLSDQAYRVNKKIYDDYIAPLWNGEVYYLCNSYTYLPNNMSYPLNADNLKNEIDYGYNLIHECSHGTEDSWVLRNGNYSLTHASAQKNIFSSVIVTNACSTNAFDKDECLSKSLINNENGGAIAYFGSSREGYYQGDFIMEISLSLKYDAYFFKKLFEGMLKLQNTSQNANRNKYKNCFGVVSTEAKRLMAEESKENNKNRYLQFSINLIGDPEMEIHTDNIRYFGNAKMGVTSSGPELYFDTFNGPPVLIDAKEEGCKIVLIDSEGSIHVKENTRTASFTGLKSGSWYVGIFKNNFRPYIVERFPFQPLNHINLNISTDDNKTKLISLVRFEGSDENGNEIEPVDLKDWNLEIINTFTGEKKVCQKVLDTTVSIDTSGWSKGVYVVRGSDGQDTDSKKLCVY